MVYVKRWIRWLLIALAIFMSVAVYGTLRRHGLDPLRTISVCLGYGVGYFYITTWVVSAIKRELK